MGIELVMAECSNRAVVAVEKGTMKEVHCQVNLSSQTMGRQR